MPSPQALTSSTASCATNTNPLVHSGHWPCTGSSIQLGIPPIWEQVVGRHQSTAWCSNRGLAESLNSLAGSLFHVPLSFGRYGGLFFTPARETPPVSSTFLS